MVFTVELDAHPRVEQRARVQRRLDARHHGQQPFRPVQHTVAVFRDYTEVLTFSHGLLFDSPEAPPALE